MAEKSFNEYLSMNPEDVAALKLLAQVHEHNKNFDKAFEMYERCYLAEPDRTGVLLDICRILLMNEIWLEHVDYRKWLNLAIKAFPNNPIVVNFKSFLTTLPPEERNSPQKESIKPSRATGDDLLAKILDKLSILDSRLEKIETKIFSKESSPAVVRQTTPSQPAPTVSLPATISSLPATIASLPATTASLSATAVNQPTTTSSLSATTPSIPTLTSTFATPAFSSFSSLASSLAATTPSVPATTPASTFSFSQTNLFADSMKKMNIPADGGWASTPAPSNFSFSAPKNDNIGSATESAIKPAFAPMSSSIFAPTSTSTSTFSFSQSNLFADSLKKLNMPTEGTWALNPPTSKPFSFSMPKQSENENNEGEGEGDNEEVVPNEELAIENTCDMTPIEIKTGEEDEDLVFEHRCKLFRFRDKEYKERGLGAIKVLKHKTTGKGRLIMRREAIGLVCLNCWNCTSVERVRDTQVRWIGLDASDGEPELTVFLAKFKTSELTDSFMSHLTELFSKEKGDTSTSDSTGSPSKTAVESSAKTDGSSDKPDVELVDPKLNPQLVDKARKLKLPDLFYHKLKNQEPCAGCNGCENDD